MPMKAFGQLNQMYRSQRTLPEVATQDPATLRSKRRRARHFFRWQGIQDLSGMFSYWPSPFRQTI